jgi:hypothetical protein
MVVLSFPLVGSHIFHLNNIGYEYNNDVSFLIVAPNLYTSTLPSKCNIYFTLGCSFKKKYKQKTCKQILVS